MVYILIIVTNTIDVEVMHENDGKPYLHKLFYNPNKNESALKIKANEGNIVIM